MSKRRFTYAQKYALWRAYDMKCFYCDRPLNFKNLTVDHVLPERLRNNQEELEAVLTEFEVMENFPDFSIDDYSNWVPSDGPSCNFRKGSSIFPKQFTLFLLNRIQNNLPKVVTEISKLTNERNEAKILNLLGSAIENDVISKSRVLKLLKDIEFEETIDEPLVVTYGLIVPDILELDEFPNSLKYITYPFLCDQLETQLVEFLRGITKQSFHYSEPSHRDGEALSVRLVFPTLTLDDIGSIELYSIEHFLPWWQLLEITNYYQVYESRYQDDFGD